MHYMNVTRVIFKSAALIAILGALPADPCLAQGDPWSEYRLVESVSSESGGVTFVLKGTKIVSSATCSNRFRIDANDPTAAWKVSQVKAAEAAGDAVRVSYIPSAGSCAVLALEIQMQKK